RGKVGGGGGGKAPILECADPSAERIVGISVQMSDQDTAFGGRSAQGIRIACARVEVGVSGTMFLGPVSVHDAGGIGRPGWSPSTFTPLTSCQPGWVVTGLLAHRGATDNRFLDVSITCNDLASTGGLGQKSETKKVTGSLVDATGVSQVQCAANEVV